MTTDFSPEREYSDSQLLLQKYTLKKVLLWWIPLMLLLAAAFSYIYYQRIALDNARLRTATRIAVNNSAGAIQARLNWILKDVLFLADMSGVLVGNRSALTPLFLSMMQNRLGIYDQIRLLGNNGKETIRVGVVNNDVQLVPIDQLQDKSSSYYFQQAQTLQKGEILMSRFDLNVEHGAVEMPNKSMIRFVARAYDKTDKALGFVVLNYLGRDLMNLIIKSLPDYTESLNKFWLLNEKGYWMHGPRPELEWGFMFSDKQDKTVEKLYPEIWKAIQTNPMEGQLQVNGGLLTYTSYHIQGLYQLERHLLFSNPNERWFLVDFIPASQLAQRRHGLFAVLLPVFLLIAITLSILLWLMLKNQGARWLVRQREQLFV
ncbi:MAG: hypothetical protein ACU84H_11065, partial [Gammaproteobacteria bacterium]